MRFTETLGEQRKRRKLPPCKTVAEFASEFGVSPQSLAGRLGTSPTAPKASVRTTHSTTTAPRNYYSIPAMRKWWAEQQAKE